LTSGNRENSSLDATWRMLGDFLRVEGLCLADEFVGDDDLV
jgi:hypothetical protein